MKIRAVDTALGACSAAMLDGDAVRSHRLEVIERGHAEALAPMVRAVMREAEMTFAELDRLAVTTGPGTFTGQRVGLAFMRGLRIALKSPLVGITTLQTMAAAAMAETGLQFAAALHDAKRGEVYAALYSRDDVLIEPALLMFDDAISAIRDRVRVQPIALCGTAAATAVQALGGGAHITFIVHPDALWVARLAQHAPEPTEAPRPLYLRPPDARLPAQTK